MKIEYPSNYELPKADYFAFTAPFNTNDSFSSEQGRIIQIDKLTLSEPSMEVCSIYTNGCSASVSDYLQEQFDNFTNNFSNYLLVEGPADIEISGNPAKKAIFQCGGCFALLGLIPTSPSAELQNLMEIVTVDQISGNVLLIELSIKEGKYSHFPPVHIQRMLDFLESFSPV